MAGTHAFLERVNDNIRDAQVESLSAQNRARAAYDAAVFCGLAFAEAKKIPVSREDPASILRIFACYLGRTAAQDIDLLFQLHRRCRHETAHTVTREDALRALDSAVRIQGALAEQLRGCV